MKKTHRILITLLLTIALAACGTQSAATTPTETSSAATTTSAVVTFADPVLEAMLRGTMGKPQGDITQADAQAVTRMDLSDALQRRLSETTPITDLGGLEAFTNLEILDLSGQNITDISPLQGLTKLTALSLAGNPVADISPLAKLTNLKLLILSNSQAQDYSALANLVNLEVLLLDHSTLADPSSLSSLANLRKLYLANSLVEDFQPLENIYPNLEEKDFIISSTLKDLGFTMDYDKHQANFEGEGTSFLIHHSTWGPPEQEDNQNIIRISTYLEGDYKLSVGYYDVHKAYVCQMGKEGQPPMNYLYFIDRNEFSIGDEERARSEQMILAAMKVEDGEDPLFAPVRFFNEKIKSTFHTTPEKLFALPFEPKTLNNLGFIQEETADAFMYEQHEGYYVNIRINRAEEVEKEYDVVYFQSINDEYRVNITYFVGEKKFFVKADDNDQGGASYFYFTDTGKHIDEWCSDPDKTVEEYFIKAYNDPAIEEIYQHSVDLMVEYIRDTFGLTVEELYALPIGE